METNGIKTEHDIGTFWNALDDYSAKHMSIYTPFIPISLLKVSATALLYRDHSIPVPIGSAIHQWIARKCGGIGRADLAVKHQQKVMRQRGRPELIYRLLDYIITNFQWEEGRNRTRMEINDYLARDQAITRYHDNINNSTADMHATFTTSEISTFSLRTYRGSIGNFQFSKRLENGDYEDYILPVILPQNLYYQKLHVLTTGKIDLSKVIILIDKRLEDPDFALPGMRKFYEGRLKPQLRASAAQLWFVPPGYIEQNCYISRVVSLKSEKLDDRQKEIDSIADIFIDSFIRNSSVDMRRLYEPPVTVEEVIAPVAARSPEPVVLIPPVEPTPLVADRFSELVVAPETVVPAAGFARTYEALDTIREEMIAVPASAVERDNDY